MRQQRTNRSQGWVKVFAVSQRGNIAMLTRRDTILPRLRQVQVQCCRCKMRMSTLSNVEISVFIGGQERYGNGSNHPEPTRTGPATSYRFFPALLHRKCAAPVYNTHTHSAGES